MIDDLNTVSSLLLERFPELQGRMQESFGSYYDLTKELPDAYPVFEGALKHVVLELLDKDEGASFLTRVFPFLEEMASSSNRGITDLLGIAILDPLVLSPGRLARAWQYMGKKTRDMVRESAHLAGRPENLPLGEDPAGNRRC